ncbi:MAG: hypothetical protein LH647_23735 [Leptolyngbyaceae cyanobacterium CAN_BIN12]|nr:hypothetical protein [Leptolyngbyaceae cyanobacterium CAN_BIN12]
MYYGKTRREDYQGYIASKRRYFYGLRVQWLATNDGIPVEFAFLPGETTEYFSASLSVTVV